MPEGDVHTTADGHRLVLRRPVDPARRCRECVFSPPGGTACCTAPDCGMSAPPEERLVWVPADAPTPVAGVPVAAPAGITLRDWFAGLALAGLMALPGAYTDPAKFAPAAYWYADAMLAARERAAGEARE